MRYSGLLLSLVSAAGFGGCSSANPPTAPDAVTVEPGTGTQPAASSSVSGKFVGVGHSGMGGVKFTVANGVGRLDFADDFSVDAVPGPFVYTNTTNNANTGQPLRIGALKTRSGAQSYSFVVPPGASYTWVLVWCDPFNVPVAEASIPATP